MPIRKNTCLLCSFITRHHSHASTKNITICTHLSNPILLNQSSEGKSLPGNVNKTVDVMSQAMANANEKAFFFN